MKEGDWETRFVLVILVCDQDRRRFLQFERSLLRLGALLSSPLLFSSEIKCTESWGKRRIGPQRVVAHAADVVL